MKEYFDKDFLDNKINIGDIVVFEAPGYRSFVIGTVITKAPKSCQIEYINNWNYPDGRTEVVRQGYDQVIKYPVKEGKWIETPYRPPHCSYCDEDAPLYRDGENNYKSKYCPNCGALMVDKTI